VSCRDGNYYYFNADGSTDYDDGESGAGYEPDPLPPVEVAQDVYHDEGGLNEAPRESINEKGEYHGSGYGDETGDVYVDVDVGVDEPEFEAYDDDGYGDYDDYDYGPGDDYY
jgi:hypothetical protein